MRRGKSEIRWFREIGMEYARHYRDIEQAKEAFETERCAVLDTLEEHFETETKAQGLKITDRQPASRNRKETYYRWFGLAPAGYTDETGRDAGAAFWVERIEDDELSAGLHASVEFYMTVRQCDQLGLQDEPRGGKNERERWRWGADDGCLWRLVTSIPIQPAEAEPIDKLRALPGDLCRAFVQADRDVTQLWRKANGKR